MEMMFSLQKAPDDRLVRETLAGEQRAFARLVERYLQTAHAVAFAHTGNHADAEDAAQDAFLKAYQSLDTLRDRKRFGPWMAALTRNAAIDLVRKRQRSHKLVEQLPRKEPHVMTEPERRDEHELLRAHLMAMDEGPREVILLHYFAGHSLREVAQILDISRAAAQKRLVRAREVLSERLIRSLGEAPPGVRSREERAKSVMGAVAAAPVAWKATAATGTAGLAGAATSVIALATPKTLALSALVIFAAGFGLWKVLTHEDAPPPQIALAANDAAPDAAVSEPIYDRLFGDLPSAVDKPEPGESPIATPNQIHGHVIDETGKLMPGVNVLPRLVTTKNDGTEELSKGEVWGVTDGQGAFVIDGLAAGTYDAQLLVPGSNVYTSKSFKRFALAEDEAIDGMQIVYDRTQGTLIFGRVVDLAGTPVPDAQVSTKGTALFEARTDANGGFAFTRFEGGEFNLSAFHPKHGSASLLKQEAKAEGFEIVLGGRGAIEGQVVAAETGEPLTNFSITVGRHWRQDYTWNDNLTLKDFHDADGRFRIENIDAGNMTLIARAPGRATKFQIGATVQPGETASGIIVPLERGVSLEGKVVDADGSPIANADVFEGYLPDVRVADYPKVAKGRTDADGHFAIGGLAPNTTSVSAYHPEHMPAGTCPIDLSTTSPQPVTITIGLGAEVAGHVYLDGMPLDAVKVRAPGGSVRTDGNGYYKLHNVSQGTGNVRATLIDGPGMLRSRWRSVPITITPGHTIDVDIEFSSTGGAIEGVLTYNGTAPSNMGVAIHVVEPSGCEESLQVPIEPDGTYRIEAIPAGSVMVTLQWNLEPNSVAAWPTTLKPAVQAGEVLRQDFVFEGTDEDIEQGFWDAAVAKWPYEAILEAWPDIESR